MNLIKGKILEADTKLKCNLITIEEIFSVLTTNYSEIYFNKLKCVTLVYRVAE